MTVSCADSILIVLLSCVASCGSEPSADAPPALPGMLQPPCSTEDRYFVVDDIDFGTDGVPINMGIPEYPDEASSAFGYLASVFVIDGVPINSNATASVNGGTDGWVIEVSTCPSGYSAVSSWHANIGDPVRLVPDRTLPAIGSVENGTTVNATLGMGMCPYSLFFALNGNKTDWVLSNSTAFEITVGVDELDGVIAFALPADLRNQVGVLAASAMNEDIAGDPGCPTSCTLFDTRYALGTMDRDHDTSISGQEFIDDPLFGSAFGAWLDLIAPWMGTTAYWPKHDGIGDSNTGAMHIHAHAVTVVR
jgi:hypothetical protein